MATHRGDVGHDFLQNESWSVVRSNARQLAARHCAESGVVAEEEFTGCSCVFVCAERANVAEFSMDAMWLRQARHTARLHSYFDTCFRTLRGVAQPADASAPLHGPPRFLPHSARSFSCSRTISRASSVRMPHACEANRTQPRVQIACELFNAGIRGRVMTRESRIAILASAQVACEYSDNLLVICQHLTSVGCRGRPGTMKRTMMWWWSEPDMLAAKLRWHRLGSGARPCCSP